MTLPFLGAHVPGYPLLMVQKSGEPLNNLVIHGINYQAQLVNPGFQPWRIEILIPRIVHQPQYHGRSLGFPDHWGNQLVRENSPKPEKDLEKWFQNFTVDSVEDFAWSFFHFVWTMMIFFISGARVCFFVSFFAGNLWQMLLVYAGLLQIIHSEYRNLHEPNIFRIFPTKSQLCPQVTAAELAEFAGFLTEETGWWTPPALASPLKLKKKKQTTHKYYIRYLDVPGS